MKTRKILSFMLALVLSLGLAAPAFADEPGYGVFVSAETNAVGYNAGSAVVEKNGGVYVMNYYDSSKVEFYFDNAYLGDPVVLHTVLEVGNVYKPYEDLTVTPVIIQPGCNIYFPDFVYDPDEFPEEFVGHFWADYYRLRDDGTAEILGGSEWWFEENNLDNNRNITGSFISTFEAGNAWYWVKAAEADELSVAGFTDVHESDYYAQAVEWAKENGVTSGTSSTTFSPAATVTRAQAVTFLWRAAGSPAPSSTVSPFTDVADPSAYYYKAVLWAAEQGITNGVSRTTFGLNNTLSYDQILTFLCRAAGKSASGSDWSGRSGKLGKRKRSDRRPDLHRKRQLPPGRCGILPVETTGVTLTG